MTLVTCTPKHVNTHRLLVTGSRVILNDDKDNSDFVVEIENKKHIDYIIFLIILLLLFITIFFIKHFCIKLTNKE